MVGGARAKRNGVDGGRWRALILLVCDGSRGGAGLRRPRAWRRAGIVVSDESRCHALGVDPGGVMVSALHKAGVSMMEVMFGV